MYDGKKIREMERERKKRTKRTRREEGQEEKYTHTSIHADLICPRKNRKGADFPPSWEGCHEVEVKMRYTVVN